MQVQKNNNQSQIKLLIVIAVVDRFFKSRIMTPREKALDLVGKMCGDNCTKTNVKKMIISALIAIDEILNLKRNDITKGMYISVTPTDELYWHEVREEIRKL
jgi:hypothetical protein